MVSRCAGLDVYVCVCGGVGGGGEGRWIMCNGMLHRVSSHMCCMFVGKELSVCLQRYCKCACVSFFFQLPVSNTDLA